MRGVEVGDDVGPEFEREVRVRHGGFGGQVDVLKESTSRLNLCAKITWRKTFASWFVIQESSLIPSLSFAHDYEKQHPNPQSQSKP